MGASHGHTLHYHGHSAAHRLPAYVKILLVLAFVLAVVLVPAGQWWAFAVHAVVLGVAIAISRVPPLFLARRALIEVPFLVFAVLMPFVSTGPRTHAFGISVSQAGLDAGITLLLKGSLAVVAALLVAATTEARDLIAGFDRLHAPAPLTEIMAFMLRYVDVVAGEVRRMRIARESRGFVASRPRHWPALGHAAGALFIRSYERGERVHLAMLSRGYAGSLPFAGQASASVRQVSLAAALPAVGWLATLVAVWMARR